jgi:hypothetical protein
MNVTAADRSEAVTASLHQDHRALCAKFDRGLAWFVAVEAALALLLAWLYTPQSWAGTNVSPHAHVVAALLIGGGSASALA